MSSGFAVVAAGAEVAGSADELSGAWVSGPGASVPVTEEDSGVPPTPHPASGITQASASRSEMIPGRAREEEGETKRKKREARLPARRLSVILLSDFIFMTIPFRCAEGTKGDEKPLSHRAALFFCVQNVERRGITSPAAGHHRGSDLHVFRKARRVEQTVKKREQRAVRRAVVDRTSDDETAAAGRRHHLLYLTFRVLSTGFASVRSPAFCMLPTPPLFRPLPKHTVRGEAAEVTDAWDGNGKTAGRPSVIRPKF